MNTNIYRKAFTLIELLTVMAIIALLVSILLPSLSGARDKARSTAVQAQINAMSVGLESFHGDERKYPPSNACQYAKNMAAPATEMGYWEVCDASNNPYQGAHLLVDALVGRDSLGYDPKAPNTAPGMTTYDRWLSTNDRRAPYIPKDGVDLSSKAKPPEDAGGVIPAMASTCGPQPEHQPDKLLVRVFVDKFGWPILYYRASPTANQTTPIIQQYVGAGIYAGNGIYDGVDNEVFTSYTTPASPHKIYDANQAYLVTTWPVSSITNKFAEFIHSIRATTYDVTDPNQVSTPRPVKADTFILLSAGKDGIYGTLDDVANFNVLSEDR